MHSEDPSPRNIVIVGASSDIGIDLMRRYLDRGDHVIGTFRKAGSLATYDGHKRARTLALDLDDDAAPRKLAAYLQSEAFHYDLLIFASGSMEPIGPFSELDGPAWAGAIHANALMPLLIFQAVYPTRRSDRETSVVFFAGGGTNGPFTNYSAYCTSKIILIKMCELLDDEIVDSKFFILGPGYVKTKIHDETLRAGELAGSGLAKTMRFLETQGTPLADIFDAIEWCVASSKAEASGRNLSVVHDPWRDGGNELKDLMRADPNRFKLRRSGNFDKGQS